MRALHLTVSALALTFAPIAQAEESRTIPVSAADLSSEDGVSALHMRVQRAALAVCRETQLVSTPFYVRRVRSCAEETAAAAIATARIPALSAYHAARTDTPFQSAGVETIASR